MSETPESQPPAETTAEPNGIAWGDPITPERLAELRDIFKRQQEWAAQPDRDIEQSVFSRAYERANRVQIFGPDVFWLSAMSLVGPYGDLEEAATHLRPPEGFIIHTSS